MKNNRLTERRTLSSLICASKIGMLACLQNACVAEDLEPRPVWIIHEEKRDAIIIELSG